MLKRKQFLIGGLVVALALGFLLYNGFTGAATYYYTVSELSALGSSVYGENIRVNGKVAPGSVEREEQGTLLRFSVIDADSGQGFPVVYRGVVPDTFKEDSEVVAEGYLDSSGIFYASTVLAKCPSRYEPAE
ncbi:MAG: cytochrome c maturation protein CcmE [Chloroflexi bacterium]|nr:cytochrome c maturation protein CcmE [Chloroflexota bacterium]